MHEMHEMQHSYNPEEEPPVETDIQNNKWQMNIIF